MPCSTIELPRQHILILSRKERLWNSNFEDLDGSFFPLPENIFFATLHCEDLTLSPLQTILWHQKSCSSFHVLHGYFRNGLFFGNYRLNLFNLIRSSRSCHPESAPASYFFYP